MRTSLRIVVSMLLGFGVAIATLVMGAGSAWACDVLPQFSAEAALFEDGRFTQPDGDLAAAFDDWQWDGADGAEAAATIVGVYEIETVATVEPVDAWTRGSVYVVSRYWGAPPDQIEPFSTGTHDLAVEANACELIGDGPELGSISYRVAATDYVIATNLVGAPSEAALTAAFGDPTVVELDRTAVAMLEDELLDTRGNNLIVGVEGQSPALLLVSIGVIALLVSGGSVACATRR